jgi:hypothetical protein
MSKIVKHRNKIAFFTLNFKAQNQKRAFKCDLFKDMNCKQSLMLGLSDETCKFWTIYQSFKNLVYSFQIFVAIIFAKTNEISI